MATKKTTAKKKPIGDGGQNRVIAAEENRAATVAEFDRLFKIEFEKALEESKNFKIPKRGVPYDPITKARVILGVLAKLRTGMSLNQACEEVEDAPLPHNFREWVRLDSGLEEHYTRAREAGYQAMADELQYISDTTETGVKTVTESLFLNGKEVQGSKKVTETKDEMLGHRRLRTDTRKWMLAKMLPKVYGDKLAIESNKSDDFVAQLATIAAKLPV